MSILEIFTANPIINYLLINIPENSNRKKYLYKYPFIILLMFCAFLRLFCWYWQLKTVPSVCYAETIAGIIIDTYFSLLTILSRIYHTLKARHDLKQLFNKIDENVRTLEYEFRTIISFNRQRIVVKYSVIALALYISVFLLSGLSVMAYDPSIVILEYIADVVGESASWLQAAWILYFTAIELVLLSILVNQIQTLSKLDFKFNLGYAKLNLGVNEQSTLINEVFGIITLTSIVDSFRDIILILWSVSKPDSSCIMGGVEYGIFAVCIWNLVIIECGQRPYREVCGYNMSFYL